MSTIFLDVDTQLDFLSPSGVLYVPGAERIVPAVGALNRYASAQRIPLISTTDAHTEDDAEFATWLPHCVVGTFGQCKPAVTLLDRRVTVPNRAGLPAVAEAAQMVLEKQTLDVFEAATFEPLLQLLAAGEAVVYGVVTEICVRLAVLGLLRSGRKVTVVTDAVAALDPPHTSSVFAEFRAAGGHLATLAHIAG